MTEEAPSNLLSFIPDDFSIEELNKLTIDDVRIVVHALLNDEVHILELGAKTGALVWAPRAKVARLLQNLSEHFDMPVAEVAGLAKELRTASLEGVDSLNSFTQLAEKLEKVAPQKQAYQDEKSLLKTTVITEDDNCVIIMCGEAAKDPAVEIQAKLIADGFAPFKRGQSALNYVIDITKANDPTSSTEKFITTLKSKVDETKVLVIVSADADFNAKLHKRGAGARNVGDENRVFYVDTLEEALALDALKLSNELKDSATYSYEQIGEKREITDVERQIIERALGHLSDDEYETKRQKMQKSFDQADVSNKMVVEAKKEYGAVLFAWFNRLIKENHLEDRFSETEIMNFSEEEMSNRVDSAYLKGPGAIIFDASKISGDLYIKIIDRGVGFNQAEADRKREEGVIGGFGLENMKDLFGEGNFMIGKALPPTTAEKALMQVVAQGAKKKDQKIFTGDGTMVEIIIPTDK